MAVTSARQALLRDDMVEWALRAPAPVPWRPGVAESDRSGALCLSLPAGQQGGANPQPRGSLGAAGAKLAGLRNRTALGLRTEVPTL